MNYFYAKIPLIFRIYFLILQRGLSVVLIENRLTMWHISKEAFIVRSFDKLKSGKFLIKVKWSSDGCLSIVNTVRISARRCYIHIFAWGSNCSFHCEGHSRASIRETSSRYRLSRFSFILTLTRRVPGVRIDYDSSKDKFFPYTKLPYPYGKAWVFKNLQILRV